MGNILTPSNTLILVEIVNAHFELKNFNVV